MIRKEKETGLFAVSGCYRPPRWKAGGVNCGYDGDEFDPTPMLDRPGGHLAGARDPFKNTEDPKMGLSSP